MSNKSLAKKEIEILSKNSYVKNISEKSITYTDEFKNIFINEYENGMNPSTIFKKYGFYYKKYINLEIIVRQKIQTMS